MSIMDTARARIKAIRNLLTDPEKRIRGAVRRELRSGVNSLTIHLAFQAARRLNEKAGLELTNNHLLNIVRKVAIEESTDVEHVAHGSPAETLNNIDHEIRQIRLRLSDHERRN